METKFSSDWFSNSIPVWERFIALEFQGRPDLQFLEIGSLEGRSACWLLEHVLTHPSARLTCIDPFEGNGSGSEEDQEILRAYPQYDLLPKNVAIEGTFDRNIAAIGAGSRVVKLKGSSADFLRTLRIRFYDCVYVDGSHRALNVLRDIVHSWDLLKNGGVMILDDYGWGLFPDAPLKTPKPAIDAFLSLAVGQYDVLYKGYQVILRKTEAENSSSHPNQP